MTGSSSFYRVERESSDEAFSVLRVRDGAPEYVGTRQTRTAAQRLAEASAGRRLTFTRIRHELYESSDA